MKIEYKYENRSKPEYSEKLKEYFVKFLQPGTIYMKKIEEFKEHFEAKGYPEDEMIGHIDVIIDDFIVNGQIYYQIYYDVNIIVSVPEVSLSYNFSWNRYDLTSPNYERQKNQAGMEIIKCMDEIAKKMKTERENKEKEKAEKEAQELAKKEAEAAKIAAEKEARRQARLIWAREHGSVRLLKGLEQGYNCIKLYETELGTFLLGDEYEYDRDNRVDDKDHACPPLEALEEVERLQGVEGVDPDIVWLPQGLSELHNDPDDYNEPESGCGAVRVDVKGTQGYWYRKF